jgi:TolB protein
VRAAASVAASSLAVLAVAVGIALGASAPTVEIQPNREIFVVNADGTGRRNLTRSPARDDSPALAPNGRRLVFIRGYSHLWTMNADGTRQRRLTDASGWQGLRWSPDGRLIAFSRFTYNPDTGHSREVGLFEPGGELRWIADAFDGTWSPDGRRLAFLTDVGRGWREGPYSIAVASDDGSARRVVAHASDFNAHRLSSPIWSSRGSLIAFSLYKDSRFPLYVVDVDDPSRARRVAAYGYNPAWSPDGRRLAFDNPRGIWIVAADGSGLRLVVSSRSFSGARNPAWAPDGKRIAFVTSGGGKSSCDDYCPGNLLVLNPNRGRPRVLARRVQARIRPIWARAGRNLYYVGFTGPTRQ